MASNEQQVIGRIYLLEKGQRLSEKESTLDFDPYKSKINIRDVEKILIPCGFKKDSTFEDFPSYRNDSLEVAVSLNNINDYYEINHESSSKEEFLNFVHIISINVLKETNESKEVIKKLEDTFNLHSYQSKDYRVK